ncbi:hypothetical protein PQR37_34420 [Paraburkholderia nemoris]|uniref:hypothetical protein n=1 Tax=Paraburkholderia TaxID=1822464 RepID=UPI0038B7FB48
MDSQANALFLPASSCLMWARATKRCADELLAGLATRVPRDRSLVTEHFFVIASMKLKDWCDVLQALHPPFAETCQIIFEVVTEDVKDVRDMREHDDEYLQGNGRHKQRYTYSTDRFSADASSTVVDEGRYLIGGRVHVESIVAAVDRFLQELIKQLPDVNLDWLGKQVP